MKNFFTSIERNNDSYIGVVHNSNTNQPVYRTTEYSSHVDAIKDVNAYLQGDGMTSVQQPQHVISAVAYQQVDPVVIPEPQVAVEPPKRCCGR